MNTGPSFDETLSQIPPMPGPLDDLGPPTLGALPVVTSLATSPRAPLLARPGRGRIHLENTQTGKSLGDLRFDFGRIEVLQCSRSGETLLAAGGIAGKSGGAILFDVRTGAEKLRLSLPRDTVLAAAISPKETRLVLGGPDGLIHLYDLSTGEKLSKLEAHDDWILSLDISSDGNYIASGGRDGKLCIWDAATGENLHDLAAHEQGVHALCFRPDAKSLATVGGEGRLKLWNIRQGKPTRNSKAHTGPAFAVTWSTNHSLATTGKDGILKLWKPDGSPAGSIAKIGEWTYTLAFDHLSRLLFVGPWSGKVRIFDARSKKEILRAPPEG